MCPNGLGPADTLIARMKQRYAEMLSDEQSTLWELFDELTLPGFGSVGKGTYNHAWSGGPLTILSQYVAGVEPTEPGFAQYAIRPQLGPLKEIEAKVPTRSGVIDLQVRQDSEGAFKLRLKSPPGLLAEVQLPVAENGAKSDVAVNGQLLVRANETVGQTSKVKYEGQQGGYLRFAVPSGEWSFERTSNEGG